MAPVYGLATRAGADPVMFTVIDTAFEVTLFPTVSVDASEHYAINNAVTAFSDVNALAQALIKAAGEQKDPTIIINGGDKILHVPGLRVLAKHRVIIGSTGSLHRTQRYPFDIAAEQPFSDQPIGLIGSLLEMILFDKRTENI